MEYITEVLGLKVTRKKWEYSNKLPYFLTDEYDFEQVVLDDQECLFIKPKEDLAVINTIKKHLAAIKKACSAPIVFEFDKLTRQKRKSFIENRFAFIVTGKQIYLPFMGVVLQENCDSEHEHKKRSALLPSAQMLLFAFIYGKCEPLYLSDAAKRFNITPMSVSRAATQLIELNLLNVETNGRAKILCSTDSAKELFYKAKPFLINPVRKTGYADKAQINGNVFLSGLSAVSKLSMLNPPHSVCYGTTENINSFECTDSLIDTDKQCAIDFWKYDTTLLSGNNCADILSLAIYFDETSDGRVENEIEEILEKVW